MKRERILSCLTAGALGFCLGFGGAACMVTGLELPVQWLWLVCGCAVNTVIAAVCFSRRHGGRILAGIWSAYGLWMVFSGSFWEQTKALLRDTMDYYHRAYGIGIPEWLSGEVVATQIQPLLLIAGGVTVAAVWTILRRKRAFLPVGAALLPLISCLVVTDTVPENWALYLLLAGLVLLMMTQSVRRRDAGQGNRLTGLLALPVAAALGLLFWMVPRGDYSAPVQMDSIQNVLDWFTGQLPHVGQTSDGTLVFSFGGDATDAVKLSAVGKKTSRSTPVMEVTAELSGQIYLRGRDYDVYDGVSWTATEDRTEELGAAQVWTRTGGTVSVRTLAPRGQFYLPYYTVEGQTLTGGMARNPEGVTEYSYEVRSLQSNWEDLWAMWRYSGSLVTSDKTEVDDRYLELPEQTRQRAEAILGTVLSGGENSLEMAQSIWEYVRDSASYDLDTQRMPGSETDFAMWFLEESDTGYCVHFASAAAVLLRAAGIPARYVEGYVLAVEGGERAVVRESMAHAWVEYYLQGMGWVILDATPGGEDEPEETAPTQETTQPTQTTAPAQTTGVTVPQTTGSTTGETAASGQNASAGQSGSHGGTETTSVSSSEEKTLPAWFGKVLWVLMGLAVLALCLIGQWALRRERKLRRMHRGKVNAQALARYREAARLAGIRKVPLPEELRGLAEKARFSQHTLTQEELSRFDEFLRRSVRELRKKPWYCRLVYRLVFAAY